MASQGPAVAVAGEERLRVVKAGTVAMELLLSYAGNDEHI
jgi:hypothetical protein